MKNLEDLWAFMLANLKFSRTDKNFMSNVWAKYLSYDRAVTPKQGELFLKLVKKYRRQLATHNIDAESIALPWKNIPAEPNIDSRIWIEGEELRMSWPFHLGMVEDWKRIRAKALINEYRWESTSLYWYTESSVTAIRKFLEFRQMALDKHNVELKITGYIKDIDDSLKAYDSNEWQVMARLTNDRIYVNNINATLDEHLPKCLDITLETVYNLNKLGVQVDTAITDQLASQSGGLLHLVTSDELTLAWTEANGRELLEYLEMFDLTAFIVLDETHEQYARMLRPVILKRPSDRLHIYSWVSPKDSWETDQYTNWLPTIQARDSKLASIDFDTVDVMISSRKIFTSMVSEIARVVRQRIYYVDFKDTESYWKNLE